MKLITTFFLLLLCASTSFAQADAARFEGDLKVNGIHFGTDSSTLYTSKGLVYNKGAWTAGVAYSAGEIVQSSGVSYVCTSANTDSPPPNANWSVLSAQGTQGIQGIQGFQGAQGVQGLKGDKGDAGVAGAVTLSSICTAITSAGGQLPSFCPNYTVTYTLADLKGTWKSHLLSTSTVNLAWWERSTTTISATGVATVTAYLNSDGSTTSPNPPPTYAISSDGTVTIVGTPPYVALSGTMSMDKNVIVLTMNTDGGADKAIGVSVKIAP